MLSKKIEKMTCVNCNKQHEDKFCPDCGEKSLIPKISFRSMFDSALYTITNMDKGFLFNMKHLLLNPQKIVTDYIKGKRKGVFNPVSFLIVTITIYLITDSFIEVEHSLNDETQRTSSRIYNIGYEAAAFTSLYAKYFWMFSIVWLAISTKLIFGKYNYPEHLVISSFVIGQSTLIGLVFFLITKVDLLFNPILYTSVLWMNYKIFQDKKNDLDTFIQTCLSTFFFFVQLVFIMIVIGIFRS